MNKLKIGVIFGGMSTEHDVSVVSGTSVIKNLNKDKYEIIPIYIDKNGEWFSYDKKIETIDILKVGEEPTEISKIENVLQKLKSVDVVFPVLHGLYGEDGTIQGLFELLKLPYVGCKVLGSCVCMDKAYTKVILEKAGIPQVKHMYVKRGKEEYIFVDESLNEIKLNIKDLSKKVEKRLGLPVFIKPSNSGSSVGVNKAHNLEEVEKFIEYASQFDSKIIVEESINAREIECAVLGNEDVEASILGEILPAEEFYSFDAKYNIPNSQTIIPAKIEKKLIEEIQKNAIKAFKSIDGRGLARVDFFIEEGTNNIYINEINTCPGSLSFYLWEPKGKKYRELLDEMIKIGIKDYQVRTKKVHSFDSNILAGYNGTKGAKGSKFGGSKF